MTAVRIYPRLHFDIDTILSELPGPTLPVRFRSEVARQATEDLLALAARDAAANGDPDYVHASYSCFRAVLAYRIAHKLWRLAEREPVVTNGRTTAGRFLRLVRQDPADRFRTAARRLSEQVKVHTGVEIHPAATIGRRFVIDHGVGTVIGEQTRLGEECYLLNRVVLGGPSIGDSSAYRGVRRHPWIGDRVEIGAGVSVFGPVTIGDDCQLESGVRVTGDLPAGSRVRLVSITQISSPRSRVQVHSVCVVPDGLLVTGVGLQHLRPALLDDQRAVLSYLPVRAADEGSIRCGRPPAGTARARLLGLFDSASLECYVAGATELKDL